MENKLSNPYIRKACESDIFDNNVCSIGGITRKIFFFSLLTFIGIFTDVLNLVPIEYSSIALFICCITAFITSIINIFVPSAVHIIGSIFCLTEGYIVGWLCKSYSIVFSGIVPISLLLTLFVVFSMAILYSAKIIKVNQKLKAVISTLFLASVLFSLFVFITSFFTPVLINFFYGYGYIAFGIALIDVILASLYLVVDFDNIAQCVNNQYSQKCEWQLAFGLIMSIIILFIRILRLVARVMRIFSDR